MDDTWGSDSGKLRAEKRRESEGLMAQGLLLLGFPWPLGGKRGGTRCQGLTIILSRGSGNGGGASEQRVLGGAIRSGWFPPGSNAASLLQSAPLPDPLWTQNLGGEDLVIL